MSEDDLLALLGHQAEPAEARGAIREITQAGGLHPPFSREAALQIFETLASRTGLLAVLARFAKARVLLAATPASPLPRRR